MQQMNLLCSIAKNVAIVLVNERFMVPKPNASELADSTFEEDLQFFNSKKCNALYKKFIGIKYGYFGKYSYIPLSKCICHYIH